MFTGGSVKLLKRPNSIETELSTMLLSIRAGEEDLLTGLNQARAAELLRTIDRQTLGQTPRNRAIAGSTMKIQPRSKTTIPTRAAKLLEHEYRTGDRRAKCRGKPSARTGGQKCLDIVLVTSKGGRKKMTNARPHLDGRSLSAEGEPGAHGQRAAEEFHRDQNQRRRRLLVTQHRLDVGDAAPFCSWREFSDEPGSQSSGDGRNTDDEREASNLLAVRPIDD
jgi:hypothetical protein